MGLQVIWPDAVLQGVDCSWCGANHIRHVQCRCVVAFVPGFEEFWNHWYTLGNPWLVAPMTVRSITVIKHCPAWLSLAVPFRKLRSVCGVLMRTSSSSGRQHAPAESFHYLRVRSERDVCFRRWSARPLEGNQSPLPTAPTSRPAPTDQPRTTEGVCRLTRLPALRQIVRAGDTTAGNCRPWMKTKVARVTAPWRHANDGVGPSEGTGAGQARWEGGALPSNRRPTFQRRGVRGNTCRRAKNGGAAVAAGSGVGRPAGRPGWLMTRSAAAPVISGAGDVRRRARAPARQTAGATGPTRWPAAADGGALSSRAAAAAPGATPQGTVRRRTIDPPAVRPEGRPRPVLRSPWSWARTGYGRITVRFGHERSGTYAPAPHIAQQNPAPEQSPAPGAESHPRAESRSRAESHPRAESRSRAESHPRAESRSRAESRADAATSTRYSILVSAFRQSQTNANGFHKYSWSRVM